MRHHSGPTWGSHLALLATVGLSPTFLLAQSDSVSRDSLTRIRLPPIEVTITRTKERLDRSTSTIGVVTESQLHRGQQTVGWDEALTTVPGVYIANRYNFSVDQRISIRGFGARANFGTRGVKVLLDGVPQTLPDGQSQLTNIDLGTVDRVEVLLGASSALYGNAAGGVIGFLSAPPPMESFTERLRLMSGAFGTTKWQSLTTGRLGAAQGTLSIARFRTDGFRQQSAADLRQLQAGVDFTLSGTSSLAVRLQAADAPTAQNPGALTTAEVATNRDSAAATSINRHADKNVTQEQASVTYHYTDAGSRQLTAVMFGVLRDLQNPLATPPPGPFNPFAGTFNHIHRLGGGFRLTGGTPIAGGRGHLLLGTDFQQVGDDRQNFTAIRGVKTDSVLADQREVVTEVGPFADLRWEIARHVAFRAGGRYDHVAFDVLDHHLTDGIDNSGHRPMAAWSGHAGVEVELGPGTQTYANVATAFETPTSTELVNQSNGSVGFNTALGPQRTTSVEVGLRGHQGAAVQYSLALFSGHTRDAIVQARESNGRAFFENAGQTSQRGVEVGLAWTAGGVAALRVSYTYADYHFTEYHTPNGSTVDTLDGKWLAGIPRHFARIGLSFFPWSGASLDLDQLLSSRVFADDRNTLEAANWRTGVTNLRMAWHGNVGRTSIGPFAAVNNLFDRSYVSSVNINGVGGRVYEPAPRRNVYVGVEIGVRSKE